MIRLLVRFTQQEKVNSIKYDPGRAKANWAGKGNSTRRGHLCVRFVHSKDTTGPDLKAQAWTFAWTFAIVFSFKFHLEERLNERESF